MSFLNWFLNWCLGIAWLVACLLIDGIKTCPFFSRMRKAKHAKTKLIKKIYIWIGNGEYNLYFLLILNQHKQSSLKIHVIFLKNLVTKKLHHTEEWTGLFALFSDWYSDNFLPYLSFCGDFWPLTPATSRRRQNAFFSCDAIGAVSDLRLAPKDFCQFPKIVTCLNLWVFFFYIFCR